MQMQVWLFGYVLLSAIIYTIPFKASNSYKGQKLPDLQEAQFRLLNILH